MRYPEATIKEAILHRDIEIRDRATMYFAKSFSPDASIMPLVIKAVETYGRDIETCLQSGMPRLARRTARGASAAWLHHARPSFVGAGLRER